MVEDESSLDEGEGLSRNRKMEQKEENYPSDKEVERPVRKSEGGRYEGQEMPKMPKDYMKMPEGYMRDAWDERAIKKKKDKK